ncbi:MAG: ATP synthase F1 subunit delta [Candidatus Hydrogenedentes bacterium]|nr:ATP synthase F1 subunit delta [Candidatus Hydrogenedentota bacterium]
MRDYLIAQRYAEGLSAAMADTARLERAVEQLADMARLLDTHHDLRSCIGNDAIDEHLRGRVLDDVLRRLGAEPEVLRLCGLLLSRDRVFLLGDIVELLGRILDERLNRTTAKVTSAAPLTGPQQDRVRQALAGFSGKEVRLTCAVDADLIGGVVAEIGGRVIDGSLRTQLERLKTELIAEEI